MKTHDLKILPEYFEAVTSGMKTFELRKDDRGFATGDHVVLWEWDGEYTHRVRHRVRGATRASRRGT